MVVHLGKKTPVVFEMSVIFLYLPGRVAVLQLSVLQHVADINKSVVPEVAENVLGPVDGHREDGAHNFTTCCVVCSDVVPTKSKCNLLMLLEGII